MRSPETTLTRFVLAIGLAGFVTACQSAPQLPLMTPKEIAGDFGYTDQTLGDDRFRVSYQTPRRQTEFSESDREKDTERVLALARDLALWRAGELAQSKGRKGFNVIETRNDVQYDRQRHTYYSPAFPAPYYPYGPYYGHRRYDHRFGYGYPYYPYYDMPIDYSGVWVQATVILDIELTDDPGPNGFLAREIIDNMKARYPTAYASPGSAGSY